MPVLSAACRGARLFGLRVLPLIALGFIVTSCSDAPVSTSEPQPSDAVGPTVPAQGASGAGASAGAAGSGGKAAPVTVAERPKAGAGAQPPAAIGGSGVSPSIAGAVSRVAGSGGATAAAAGAPAAAGASGMSAVAGALGSAEPQTTCEKGAVKASEVVFIGESFIAQTGAIPRMTNELARKAGTISMSEGYRSFAVSGTQLTTGDIPGQYDRAKAESPVNVVLMDGGGNDLLFGTNRCMGMVDAGCQEVVDVVAKMFATFKAGGTKDVVYFFYPDPMGIGEQIKDAMDVLRPAMKKLCDETADVRCIWVDQRETWEGNYDKFTSDGIHPTDAGAMASAQQIWDAMVANCVAQ